MALPFELQPTEQQVLLLRRHWLHLYPRLVLLVLLALAPSALLVAGAAALADLERTTRLAVYGACIAWTGFWLVRAYFLWYRHQHDVWVVTSQRIVDSLKRHWFHHELSSADLVDIQDVSVQREGLLRTVFDFGDVRVQTAAQQAHFVLAAIPHPTQILTTIDAARDAARRERGAP